MNTPERPTQPVDEGLLEPGEYEAACEEAEQRTRDQIQVRISTMPFDELVKWIDGSVAQDQPAVAHALAMLLRNPTECEFALGTRAVVRRALYAAIEAETKSVDPEDVLREWHPPFDPDHYGDWKYERRRDDALDEMDQQESEA